VAAWATPIISNVIYALRSLFTETEPSRAA